MNKTKLITLRLQPSEYEQLESQASRRGMPASALVQDYVRAGLKRDSAAATREKQRAGLEALERLAAFRAELRQAGYPSVDAVEVARASREDLEQRFVL